MARPKILIVDDDALLRRSLSYSLEQAGFQVSTSASAEDALETTGQFQPDLIVLDIMLPGMDGLSALRHFRDRLSIPVIFLSARHRELDQILGLELGADDYVTKPFNPDVLIARIHTVLRRMEPAASAHSGSTDIIVGDLAINPSFRRVLLDGRPVSLTAKEFDILHSLAMEPGRVLSIENLLARVWGAEYEGEPQIVYVHIRWLREKLEKDPQHPKHILTVRGVGYRLVAGSEEAESALNRGNGGNEA